MLKKLFLLSLFCFLGISGFSQESKEDIMKQQQDLQRELADLNTTLDAIKKNKKQSIGQLTLVQKKIRARQELVNNLNRQLRNINDDMYHNEVEINHLRMELDTLKDSYAKSLIFAYKNRSNYDYLNFLFSATSFNDAIKRIAYLKSYRQFRETQVSDILKTQNLLHQKIKILGSNKIDKNNTLQEQGKQLKDLESDKKEKDQVVQQLKSRESDIAAQIRNKERTRQKLAQNLQTIIRRETELARKQAIARQKEEEERQKQAVQQNQSQQKTSAADNATDANRNNPPPATTALTQPKVTRTYSPLEATAEGLTQSLNFENNKGRLPWPVSSGYVSVPFGKYEIPGTVPLLHGISDGIDISLPVGAAVKSVADGEVSSVFDLGGDQTVVVKHGKYFTTYSHLSSVNVNKGDPVNAGTTLGHAAVDDNGGGGGVITFMVTDDKGNFLDPENWLKSR